MSGDNIEALLQHAEFLRRLARGLIRDPAAADDLAQDTWLAAMRDAPDDLRAPRSWLATIARRLAGRRRRADERRRRREHRVARPEAVSPRRPDPLLFEALSAALAALPAHEREVVILRFYEGLTPTEIAIQLRTPRNTIRSRLQRGLERIRARLDGAGDRSHWTALGVLAARPRQRTSAPALATLVVAGAVMACVGVAWTVRSSDPRRETPSRTVVSTTPAPPRQSPAGAPEAIAPEHTVVRGLVVDLAANRPRAGETVNFYAADGRDLRMGTAWPVPGEPDLVGSATTGIHGAFEFALERGVVVQARVGNITRLCRAGDSIRIAVPPQRRLTGIVVAPDGDPLADVVLLAASAPVARTGESGRFSLELASHVDLVFRHERFPTLVVPAPSSNEPLTIRMPRGWVAEGTVYDVDTAQPIPGAIVGFPGRTVRANADGRYRLPAPAAVRRDQPLGNYVPATASADGYAISERRVQRGLSADFWLARGDAVTGTVRDSTGRPVGDALVAVIAETVQLQARARRTRTDGSGNFRIEGVGRNRSQRLLVLAPGHGHDTRKLPPSGDRPGIIAVGVVTLAPYGEISGTALGRDGEPLPEIELLLAKPGVVVLRPGLTVTGVNPFEIRTRADQRGRFRFANLGPGTYRIHASRPRLEATVSVTASRPLQTATLRVAPADVTVTVTDPQDRPIEGARLNTVDGSVRTDPSGRAQATSGVPVEVTAPGYVVHTALWRRGGNVKVRLERGTPTTVRVQDEANRSVPIYVTAMAGKWVRVLRADAKGWIRFVAPGPGPVVLLTAAGTHAASRTEVTPGSHGTVLRLRRLSHDRSIDVRVVAPDGTPARGVHVTLAGTAGWGTVPTGADGVARFIGLPAAPVTVSVPAPGRGRAPVPPRSATPEGQELRIQLGK